jgi:hypothetical protein
VRRTRMCWLSLLMAMALAKEYELPPEEAATQRRRRESPLSPPAAAEPQTGVSWTSSVATCGRGAANESAACFVSFYTCFPVILFAHWTRNRRIQWQHRRYSSHRNGLCVIWVCISSSSSSVLHLAGEAFCQLPRSNGVLRPQLRRIL